MRSCRAEDGEDVEECSIVESTVHTRFARVEEGRDRKAVEVKQREGSGILLRDYGPVSRSVVGAIDHRKRETIKINVWLGDVLIASYLLTILS